MFFGAFIRETVENIITEQFATHNHLFNSSAKVYRIRRFKCTPCSTTQDFKDTLICYQTNSSVGYWPTSLERLQPSKCPCTAYSHFSLMKTQQGLTFVGAEQLTDRWMNSQVRRARWVHAVILSTSMQLLKKYSILALYSLVTW